EAIADAAAARRVLPVHGLPVILKAAAGGGGRGMRVVRRLEDVAEAFERASSEATAAFGNGSMFVERFVVSARHIEVQILADKAGSVIHSCSNATAQCSGATRRCWNWHLLTKLRQEAREAILSDAVKLAKSVGYENAGTVEFLFEESTGRHYFMEVEHTVTEEITGVDIVRTQIRIAEGHSLSSLASTNRRSLPAAAPCSAGILSGLSAGLGPTRVLPAGLGPGIRLDSASAFAGAIISPYYDSLLCKVVAHTGNFAESTAKMRRALREFRVIGVSTNIAFLLNLLSCEEFCTVAVDTGFLDRNPQLMRQRRRVAGAETAQVYCISHEFPGISVAVPPDGWRKILKQKGPEAFAKAILDHPGVLLTDTTMRDAHQSLLATRVRTYDLTLVGPAVNGVLGRRHVRRVAPIPARVPMATAEAAQGPVGYTNYADNVVYRFCEEAVKTGMDIFRIFDCLNYVPNMLVGMDAVRKAGGVVEAAICYTGDLLTSKKYTLEYYLDTAEQLIQIFLEFLSSCVFSLAIFALDRAGAHILAIKDMAGLLKPDRNSPDRPLHIHTHDTAGAGVATLLACSESGADILDVSVDAMSGITAQPSMAPLSAASAGRPGVQPADVADYNAYWEMTRRLYVNFECTNTMRSGNADVYDNEIPGGQYTNLHFQSISLGLADQFALVKKKFAEANQLLGDLIKVTPSSKVVGDLAQFMVQNKLSSTGGIGQPHGGFPAELAAAVLHGRKPKYTSRPGAEIPPFDFEKLRRELEKKFGQVFDEFAEFRRQFGDVSKLSTRSFFQGPKIAEELELYLDKGITVYVKSLAITEPDKIGQRSWRPDAGEILSVRVTPGQVVAKGQPLLALSAMKMELTVASPLAGKVHSVWVNAGDKVEGNDLLVTGEDRYDAGHAHKYSGHIERQSHPALAACLPAPIVNAPLGQHSMRTKRKNQCRKAERHVEEHSKDAVGGGGGGGGGGIISASVDDDAALVAAPTLSESAVGSSGIGGGLPMYWGSLISWNRFIVESLCVLYSFLATPLNLDNMLDSGTCTGAQGLVLRVPSAYLEKLVRRHVGFEVARVPELAQQLPEASNQQAGPVSGRPRQPNVVLLPKKIITQRRCPGQNMNNNTAIVASFEIVQADNARIIWIAVHKLDSESEQKTKNKKWQQEMVEKLEKEVAAKRHTADAATKDANELQKKLDELNSSGP
uniref:pyruvate carboxylase n=1 Tax=Macrostomum lignano TaxID=282301 RepID=A0A1I8GA93_9PLAT